MTLRSLAVNAQDGDDVRTRVDPEEARQAGPNGPSPMSIIRLDQILDLGEFLPPYSCKPRKGGAHIYCSLQLSLPLPLRVFLSCCPLHIQVSSLPKPPFQAHCRLYCILSLTMLSCSPPVFPSMALTLAGHQTQT